MNCLICRKSFNASLTYCPECGRKLRRRKPYYYRHDHQIGTRSYHKGEFYKKYGKFASRKQFDTEEEALAYLPVLEKEAKKRRWKR